MKKLILITVLILNMVASYAQTDSLSNDGPPLINEEYAEHHYDSTLKVEILTYNYSNKWDLDGDGKNDAVLFVGNGGAHEYFHLRIELSSKPTISDFPGIEIDMPYYVEITKNENWDKKVAQFVVSDFDNDGLKEIFLNIGNPGDFIPEDLKEKGITSSHVLIDYEEGQLWLRNFES